MPFSSAPALEEFVSEAVDLRSVPTRRYIGPHPFMEKLRKAVPFDFFAVSGLDLDGYRFGSGHSIDTDLPPAFLDAYYGDNLLKTDPFVQASVTATEVVIEERVYEETPPPQRLIYLARTFGVLNRTLFPVRRGDVVFGAVTFSRTMPFGDDEISFLTDQAEVTHRVITRPIMEKFSAQTMKLSDGEIACLRYASLGKTTDDIATASGYTPDTVNSYIKTAIRKLGAYNRVHAIAEAIRRGIIR
ncbi:MULTISPECIES: helix-turn-helix transcriptional regulator [Shinella]|uniref:LuxR C-terminal-related transcriptional regulator n=1 Tax=Shinella sedimenti TaxID=2919913 RepID=A0ABT0CQP2_9HYPH|nr:MULTISPECIES: autoinducer binding domain-containing protein [Shinella]MCJ8150898.1 LuxR C-terminal-related transcriptional regulator [Shinella sedimenti]